MVKLVDTPDLGSGAEMCGGSSPSTRKFIFLTNRSHIINYQSNSLHFNNVNPPAAMVVSGPCSNSIFLSIE